MARKDSAVPDDWFSRAREDLLAAQLLLGQEEVPNVVGYLLHQAAEKALKAYLLASRRPVRPIHDLDALLDDAVALLPMLERHRDFCVQATEFHIDVKYPGLRPEPMEEDELEALHRQAQALLDDLESAVERRRP